MPSFGSRLFDRLVDVLAAAGAVWIFGLMLAINFDVFGRFLFNKPLAGVPTLVENSIIAIVFLGLIASVRHGRVTRSEMFLNILEKRGRGGDIFLMAVYNLLGVLLMALIFFYAWPMFEKAWTGRAYVGVEGVFTLPVWPIRLIVLVCAGLVAIQFLRESVSNVSTIAARLRDGRVQTGSLGVYAGVSILLTVISYFVLRHGGLEPVQVGLFSVFLVLVLVYVGMHVAVALSLLSFVCIWVLRDDLEIAGKMVALATNESLNRYEFGVIPLFVFMGLLVSVSDIGKEAYEVANQISRRLKAGVAIATIGASAVFAAVTGTSIASASVFTKVAVPEMLRLDYNPRFAVGTVAGSSVLGMLIPPSLLMILFGILAETSIGDLFTAGILPGIVLALAYCVLISFMARVYPAKVSASGEFREYEGELMPTGQLLLKSLPILTLVVVVLGGIYGGVFTATEAGAVGALGALILTIVKRQLTWQKLWEALRETGLVTASISFLLISAHIYSRMITLSGIPAGMEAFITGSGFSYAVIIALYLLIIIILGTILDAGSIMLLTVPLAVKALTSFDVDLAWLGVLTVIAVEIGLLTPPMGLAVFVIHSNLDDKRISVSDIFWGSAPFALTMFVVLVLVAVFPQIALFLVR
ncbi:MAG: TRAP transporter large permease subunit [Beijerinckiaceae bacterium]